MNKMILDLVEKVAVVDQRLAIVSVHVVAPEVETKL
jgi:hypothetical protein